MEYDAVIIGSGIGGLTTATQLAAKGAKVVVLERCARSTRQACMHAMLYLHSSLQLADYRACLLRRC